jgi:hypothetical protein
MRETDVRRARLTERTRRRMVAASVGVGVCVSVLSGCLLMDKGTDGLVVVKRDGEHLVVAVCADVQADGLVIFERPSRAETYETVWDAEPGIDLKSGDELSSDPGTTAPFPGEKRNAPALAAGN